MIQDILFFLVTLPHMELLGTYHIRTSNGLGIKLEGFDTLESCVKFDIHQTRSNFKKVTPAQLQTNDPELYYVDMTTSDWIWRIRQIGICILLSIRTGSRATGRDTVEQSSYTLVGFIEMFLGKGMTRTVCLCALDSLMSC